MKKYLITLLGLCLLFVIIHLGLFLAQLGVETESSRWIHEALAIKENRAASIATSKILLIGGSSTLYSFSAEELERRLGMPTVNCGIHAGLRLEYILTRYSALVKKGDVVVLPLEYAAYEYNGETSETLADFVSARDADWIMRAPATFINTAFSFSLVDLVDRNRKRFRPDKRRIGHYDASHISLYGDKTNIRAELITKRHRDELNAQKPLRLNSVSGDALAVKIISDFIRHCQSQGAEVLLTFPVTINFEAYKSGNFIEAAEQRVDIFQESGAVRLGSPSDFLLPREFFFNTLYHATAEGRSIATKKLGDLLEQHLNARRGGSSKPASSAPTDPTR